MTAPIPQPGQGEPLDLQKRDVARWKRLGIVVRNTWYLGITAFGGPAVHFQTFHKIFVEKHGWVDEHVYQELFALVQALPGSASTKMLFLIIWMHGGFVAALLSFFFWCVPGAIGMYGLAIGMSHVGDRLPGPVYALLSGLNAATVGYIALAAVQLARKVITDKLTRLLLFLMGAAGMLYSALWYFPALMFGAGIVTMIWDTGVLQSAAARIKTDFSAAFRKHKKADDLEAATTRPLERDEKDGTKSILVDRDLDAGTKVPLEKDEKDGTKTIGIDGDGDLLADRPRPSAMDVNLLSWKVGTIILALFTASFILIVVLRITLKLPSRGVALFSNMYLAGTIIFGGGPVVIPLLREYVVSFGWVSPRDFLLGVAVIQSFPGPNVNFAVYLGALATAKTSMHSFTGALIGFIGIFVPGMIVAIAFMGVWSTLRSRRWLQSLFRGINAAAVGLIYTAVYRLWSVGLVGTGTASSGGVSLGEDPWWVAITAASFVGGAWFGVNAPCAILFGGVMGLIWYAVVVL